MRRDTTSNWNAHKTVVPLLGEVIVYTDWKTIEKDGQQVNVPGVKIGDGNAYVVDLPFITDALETANILEQLDEHENNAVIHVSQEEKDAWSNKLNCAINGEILVLDRN